MNLTSEHEIKNYYAGERIATNYVKDRFVGELHRLLHERQVLAVQRVIDSMCAESILEVATGPGRVTAFVRPRRNMICLEFNEVMLTRGRQACAPSCRWVRGDGFRLPFGETFDVAYSFRFIRHFRQADRERLYAQLQRVLKPGGVLVFDAVNEDQSRPLRAANPEDYPVYDELYDEPTLRKELQQAGFVSVNLEPVQKFYTLQCAIQNLLGPRVPRINRFLIRMLERIPRRSGLEWIVTCRRV